MLVSERCRTTRSFAATAVAIATSPATSTLRMLAVYGRPRTSASRSAIDELGMELRMALEPRGRASHGLLVLLVDEPVDPALEPAQHGRLHVEALAEAEARAVRPDRLERDGAGQARADHEVVVADAGLHVPYELVRLAPSPERQRIDDAAEETVPL